MLEGAILRNNTIIEEESDFRRKKCSMVFQWNCCNSSHQVVIPSYFSNNSIGC